MPRPFNNNTDIHLHQQKLITCIASHVTLELIQLAINYKAPKPILVTQEIIIDTTDSTHSKS